MPQINFKITINLFICTKMDNGKPTAVVSDNRITMLNKIII